MQLRLELDLLGLSRVHSEPVHVRSLVGSTGSTPISLSETIDLAPTTPSHKTMVRAAPLPSTRLQRGDEIWRVPIWQVHAFASANLEDSDVYVVMHGHGGECGGGRELGTAIINLEQIEEIARDRRDRGGDRDGGAKAAGRTYGRAVCGAGQFVRPGGQVAGRVDGRPTSSQPAGRTAW